MKKTSAKLYALWLLACPLAFAACSDDDSESLNSGQATVQFKTATDTESEITTAYDIPIVVEGEHDGLIRVTVAYHETEGLAEDQQVILTEHELRIPAGTSEVQVETRLSVANDDIVPGRSLSFEIVDVQGATLGANSTFTLNLREAHVTEGTYNIVGMDAFTFLETGEKSTASLPCQLSMAEGSTDQMLLDFGYGAQIPVLLQDGEAEGDYMLTIQANGYAGNFQSYEVYFCLAALMPEQGGVGYDPESDIIGYFEGATRTITLYPAQENWGVGLLAPEAGWLAALVAYTDEAGELVPVVMQKQ